MKKFIAYFDYLGFKQFIENNDLEYQTRIIRANFRDIETALGKGKVKKITQGVVADLSKSNINCINFSDTIVFWTNDDSDSSLKEILEVAYIFNWQTVEFFFPSRGAIVYDEIEYVDFKQLNEAGGIYNINSVYGKGLVLAHEKAEKQHWAGTVIDNSFINELSKREFNIEFFLKQYAKKHKVPYKNKTELPDEWVLSLAKSPIDDTAFRNYEENIRKNFSNHKKSVESKDVQEKIENTIQFLASFKCDEK